MLGEWVYPFAAFRICLVGSTQLLNQSSMLSRKREYLIFPHHCQKAD